MFGMFDRPREQFLHEGQYGVHRNDHSMSNLFLGYAAHCSEMDEWAHEAAKRIRAGETDVEYNFPFELTEWHKHYLEEALSAELLG